MGFTPLWALAMDPLLRQDLDGSPWIQIGVDLKIARFWIVVPSTAPLGRVDLLPDLLGSHSLNSKVRGAFYAGYFYDRRLA